MVFCHYLTAFVCFIFVFLQLGFVSRCWYHICDYIIIWGFFVINIGLKLILTIVFKQFHSLWAFNQWLVWNGLSSWKVLVFIGVYVWLSDSTEKCHFLFAGCYSVHGMLPFRVFVPSLLKCFTAHSCYFAKWFRIPWKSWKSLLDIINQLSLAVQHSYAIRVLLLLTGSIVYYWAYVCVCL